MEEYARSKTAEIIYSIYVAEGRNVLLNDIQRVVDEAHYTTLGIATIHDIMCLKDSWDMIVDTLDSPMTKTYISNIGLISRGSWGTVNDKDMSVISKCVGCLDATCGSADLFEYIYDKGSERMAFLLANRLMVQSGTGVMILYDGQWEEIVKLTEKALYLAKYCVHVVYEPKTLSYAGYMYSVREVVESLPLSDRYMYRTAGECAMDKVEVYHERRSR